MCSLVETIHTRRTPEALQLSGWKIGRYKWFLVVMGGIFVWEWFPLYIATIPGHVHFRLLGCPEQRCRQSIIRWSIRAVSYTHNFRLERSLSVRSVSCKLQAPPIYSLRVGLAPRLSIHFTQLATP